MQPLPFPSLCLLVSADFSQLPYSRKTTHKQWIYWFDLFLRIVVENTRKCMLALLNRHILFVIPFPPQSTFSRRPTHFPSFICFAVKTWRFWLGVVQWKWCTKGSGRRKINNVYSRWRMFIEYSNYGGLTHKRLKSWTNSNTTVSSAPPLMINAWMTLLWSELISMDVKALLPQPKTCWRENMWLKWNSGGDDVRCWSVWQARKIQ